MSGAISLRGLVTYQQRYVSFRVLSALAVRTMGGRRAREVTGFSVEGSTRSGAPSWDVLLRFRDRSVDLHECKDTAITRDDRLTFYTRIRREITSGTPIDGISPVWVTDPQKQTPNILEHLEAVAELARTQPLSRLPRRLSSQVRSGSAALQEAVYQLCHQSELAVECRKCTTA